MFLIVQCVLPASSQASSLVAVDDAAQWRSALAVAMGRVIGSECFERADGRGAGIFTRTTIEITESLKGRLPKRLAVTHRGGVVGERGETCGDSPTLRIGDERIFFLERSPQGELRVQRGVDGAVEEKGLMGRMKRQQLRRLRESEKAAEADLVAEEAADPVVTSQAASGAPSGATTGLLLYNSAFPGRFTLADRGLPLHYVVDAAALPTGVSQGAALTAVTQALDAWSAVTGIQFVFDGLQTLGESAATFAASDERLYIQLHDTYGSVSGGTTLGVGGQSVRLGDTQISSMGGNGGQVAGKEFYWVTKAYVVLENTAASLQNTSTLAEVLTHEIGHALGMAHSSENPAEADARLKEAVMYFRAHADGRGATLGAYDPPVIQQAYPLGNTPPFSVSRAMIGITAGATPNVPGVNEVQLVGRDLQTPAAALSVTDGPAQNVSGTVARTGTTVKFTPAANYGDATLNPSTGQYYSRAFFRFGDGVNCSPWVSVWVSAFRNDTAPAAVTDGLPDSWMQTYFQSPNPSSGPNRGPAADYDGDGLTNFEEFRLGTSPVDGRSAARVTGFNGAEITFETYPYFVIYEIEGSPDLVTWSRAAGPVSATAASTTVTIPTMVGAAPFRFFRVKRYY